MSARALLTDGWRARLAHVRALTRLLVALAGSALTALLLPHGMAMATRAVAAWDGFALIALVLTWITILTLRPTQICTLAQREDPSRVLSLTLVVAGAGASLLAVVVLLKSSMAMVSGDRMRAIGLALSAVALAWLLIHTVFTLRYAHLFYEDGAAKPPLEFPGGDDTPDYLDFAYFAFVIGMTAQTADVAIHGRGIRRTALLHGVVSFAFNTAVVALSIGVLTTLL
ncbi:MAG: DUF1345 domain-containing protein [Gemmatimonas sp.]